MPKTLHVEIFGSKFSWYVRLVGANGEKLAISESYYSKWGAKRAATRAFKDLPIEYV